MMAISSRRMEKFLTDRLVLHGSEALNLIAFNLLVLSVTKCRVPFHSEPNRHPISATFKNLSLATRRLFPLFWHDITLLLPDTTAYSVDLLKQYISTLGLRFVVFQRSGKFDGWISSSTFVAQLPEDKDTVDYNELRRRIIGVNEQTVLPNDSAKEVLGKMQELHFDSIPVVDIDKRWLFFANRGEILARLMTTIILEKQE